MRKSFSSRILMLHPLMIRHRSNYLPMESEIGDRVASRMTSSRRTPTGHQSTCPKVSEKTIDCPPTIPLQTYESEMSRMGLPIADSELTQTQTPPLTLLPDNAGKTRGGLGSEFVGHPRSLSRSRSSRKLAQLMLSGHRL